MIANILHTAAGMEREEFKYRHRPSGAGPERCIRELVYKAKETTVDRQINDRILHIFQDGHWHEELTNDWIRKTTYKLHSEQMTVECGYGLKGHIDGIIEDMLGNEYLYEHKGMNHFTFQRYEKDTRPLDYFTQCALYLKGLMKVNPDINKAILLVKNKNTSAFLEFILRYDDQTDTLYLISMAFSENSEVKNLNPPEKFPNITQNAVDRFKLVDEHVVNETLPDRPYELGTDFPCGYCQWQTTCWAEYEKEHEALIEDVELEGETIDTIKYFCEVRMHLKNMKKEFEGLKDGLRDLLKKNKAKSIKAGLYRVKTKLGKRKNIKKDLIPANMIETVTEEITTETLTVTKEKEAK